MIDQLSRDVRQAFRSIARMPVLATVIVVSLGIGIGVNTVVFAWIQARVLKPLPGVASAASFHWVEARTETGSYPGLSWPEYRDLQERLRSFKELIAFRMVPLYLGEAGQVERAFGLLVSDNYFPALGLQPALGRFLLPEEVASAGREPVAVISYGLWQRRYGSDPAVLARPVRVNGRSLTIVGVAPRAFQGTVVGLNFEVWLPATLAPIVLPGSRELEDRAVRGYSVMGRLAGSLAQARSDVEMTTRQLAQAFPQTNATIQGEVFPFGQSPRGPQRLLNVALAVLQGLMLLMLLAVCGNTANLVLARASARQREMGVRLALGAGPGRIASLLLTENVVLSSLGAVVGAAIAIWGTPALVTLPLSGLPIRFQTSVDGLTLTFAMALGVVCGLLFGAAPALHLARVDPQTAFRAGSRSAGRSGLRHALMGIQVALALLVLIGAGLFYRSFMGTRDTDPGFRREGVMLAAYDLAGRSPTQASSRAFAAGLLERLRALPAVESAAIASSVPLDIHGLPSRIFTLEGRARTGEGFDDGVANTVTADYFAVMGIPLLTGSGFADFADVTTAPQVIVNDAFVQRYIIESGPAGRPIESGPAGRPSESGPAGARQDGLALGRRLQVRGRTYTIAGVVRTSLYNAFGEPPTPAMYFSYRDNPVGAGEIHLRTRPGAESALIPDVRRIVRELDAELPVFNVRTLTDHIETNLVFRRVPARLFTVLGPLLLVLAAIGIYGVVAYTVSLRTTEIGVRLALGATARRVAAQFVGESLLVITLGALAGWTAAFVVALNVAPAGSLDVAVFVAVPFALLIVAAVASWLPVRRATLVEPVVALRSDG